MNYPSWTNEVSVKLSRVRVFMLSLRWFLFLQVAACSESFRQIAPDIYRLPASWRNEFCEWSESKHQVNIQVCWVEAGKPQKTLWDLAYTCKLQCIIVSGRKSHLAQGFHMPSNGLSLSLSNALYYPSLVRLQKSSQIYSEGSGSQLHTHWRNFIQNREERKTRLRLSKR